MVPFTPVLVFVVGSNPWSHLHPVLESIVGSNLWSHLHPVLMSVLESNPRSDLLPVYVIKSIVPFTPCICVRCGVKLLVSFTPFSCVSCGVKTMVPFTPYTCICCGVKLMVPFTPITCVCCGVKSVVQFIPCTCDQIHPPIYTLYLWSNSSFDLHPVLVIKSLVPFNPVLVSVVRSNPWSHLTLYLCLLWGQIHGPIYTCTFVCCGAKTMV